MIVAYVILALYVGLLTTWIAIMFTAAAELREEFHHLRSRFDKSQADRKWRIDATDAELESLKNRIGRLRARIRKLEERAATPDVKCAGDEGQA